MKWKVVVKGGGRNLFQISEYDDVFYVYQITTEIFTDKTQIGKTDSLEKALILIMAYSGKEIEKATDW